MKPWWSLGATLGGLAVALGAFGAHGLKGRVDAHLLQVFETAARYHMFHAIALLALGLAADRMHPVAVKAAGIAFVLGLFLFSGSLYAMTLTGLTWLGAITPLGGLSFMVGWGMLAWGGYRGRG